MSQNSTVTGGDEQPGDDVETSQQFLTFLLSGEEYGVDILRVQEIKGWDSVTSIPNTPNHLLGVLNLRGSIVPIVNLRERFGLEDVAYGMTTVIIVLNVERDDVSRIMGIVVDAVSDVCNVTAGELKDAPEMGDGAKTDYIKGLAVRNEAMVILLDIDALLMTDDLVQEEVEA